LKSTERFSSRVTNYARYRPSYPAAALETLRVRCHLGAATVVADVGSGTGILTELLLESGADVYAVEPNRPMREAAEAQLRSNPRFHSVDGSAEATTLPPASIHLITAAQAFHWFDVARARREFARILVPQGWVALLWNERPADGDSFLNGYEALVRRHAPEYDQVTERRINTEAIRELFGRTPELATFANQQSFDFEGLKGRLLSSSFAPEAGHPQHAPLMEGLRQLFDCHQHGGEVVFRYQTLLFIASLYP
jgi:SAM-dependent methyltransferase